jgi:hypothetical protein
MSIGCQNQEKLIISEKEKGSFIQLTKHARDTQRTFDERRKEMNAGGGAKRIRDVQI